MAIKFTFTLNDAEAENLFICIQNQRFAMDTEIIKRLEGGAKMSDPHVKWYKAHKDYLGRMTKLMLANQERCEDSPEFSCD